jgi:hypothetical protein
MQIWPEFCSRRKAGYQVTSKFPSKTKPTYHQSAIDHGVDGIIDVCVFQDEYGSLGTELEDTFLEDLGGVCRDVAPHFVAPCERDPPHGLVVDDVFGQSRRVFWRNGEEVEDACRQSSLQKDLGDESLRLD